MKNTLNRWICVVLLFALWLGPAVKFIHNNHWTWYTFVYTIVWYFIIGAGIAINVRSENDDLISNWELIPLWGIVLTLPPASLRRFMGWWRGRVVGRKPIYGKDWNYADGRKSKIIGYITRSGKIVITDRKTQKETLP